MLYWLAIIFALTGNILVIHRRRSGFACWMFANVLIVIQSWQLQAWNLLALFIAYFVLALWGFLKWRPK